MTADIQQIPDIAATPAWQALHRHHDQIGETHLRELFAEDPDRGSELALTVGDRYRVNATDRRKAWTMAS